MYIVEENDKRKINKAAELAKESSEQLADVIRTILTLEGKERPSMDIIKRAIDITSGKKQFTDLQLKPAKRFFWNKAKKRANMGYLWVSSSLDQHPEIAGHPFALDPREFLACFDFSGGRVGLRKRRKDYINKSWNIAFDICRRERQPIERTHSTALNGETLVVRNR